jgi:hypothetical protein
MEEAAIAPAIKMAGVTKDVFRPLHSMIRLAALLTDPLPLSLAWCPALLAFTAIRGKTWQEPRRKPPHQVPKEPGDAGLFVAAAICMPLIVP